MAKETVHADWLSTSQAARALGVTPCRVRQLLADGALRHTKTPLGRLVCPASVEELRQRRLLGRRVAPAAF